MAVGKASGGHVGRGDAARVRGDHRAVARGNWCKLCALRLRYGAEVNVTSVDAGVGTYFCGHGLKLKELLTCSVVVF